MGAFALLKRYIGMNPFFEATALDEQVDAQHGNDDDIQHKIEDAGNQRHNAARDALGLVDDLIAKAINLALRDAEAIERFYQGRDMLAATRGEQVAHVIRQQACLSDGGVDDEEE